MKATEPELSLIVPAYNEALRLSGNLLSIWNYLRRRFEAFELIVVDDGSTDGTATIVETFAAHHAGVKLISYVGNLGKGYAVRRGVLASRGRYVLFSDADQSTPMREARKLLQALSDHEIAIGSRAVKTARIVECQPFYRVMMGKTFNKIVQLLAVPGIKDTQCGFKCFRGDIARDLFSQCRINGFSFDVEVLFLARCRGVSIKEVGVFWRNDKQSKVHPVIHSLQMLRDLLLIRYHHRHQNYLGLPSLRVGIKS